VLAIYEVLRRKEKELNNYDYIKHAGERDKRESETKINYITLLLVQIIQFK
jgi:hypothetical protein